MVTHKEKTTANARINIRYNDGSPEVKFSYPKKDKGKSDIITVGMYTFILAMFSSLLQSAYYEGFRGVEYPAGLTTSLVTIFYILIFWIIYIPTLGIIIRDNYGLFIARMHKNGKHYYAKFKEVPRNKIIEIPLFENIFMDYHTKGEFSDYLEEIDIREHPFRIVSRKRKGQKRKLLPNDELWKAEFKFKRIPKEGGLEVWWR